MHTTSDGHNLHGAPVGTNNDEASGPIGAQEMRAHKHTNMCAQYTHEVGINMTFSDLPKQHIKPIKLPSLIQAHPQHGSPLAPNVSLLPMSASPQETSPPPTSTTHLAGVDSQSLRNSSRLRSRRALEHEHSPLDMVGARRRLQSHGVCVSLPLETKGMNTEPTYKR